MLLTRFATACMAVLAAALVAIAQPHSDASRRLRTLHQELIFLPSAEGVRLASSGQHEVVADLMWVRTVLLFGERYDSDDSLLWRGWLGRMIRTVNVLDPRWRTPYMYGGAMLAVSGQIDASSEVYAQCTQSLPLDYWCPFARGMNDFIHRNDPLAAAVWVKEAASRPGAPNWYASAAAALSNQAGQRLAGLRYLDEQLAATTDPGVRENLEFQRGRLAQDEIVAAWEPACREWRAEHGPLTGPEDLAKLGFVLPKNPRGDAWVVGRDGVVRSEQSERDRVRRRHSEEWKLLRR